MNDYYEEHKDFGMDPTLGGEDKAAKELRSIWMRVGMTLDITKEEEKILFEGSSIEGQDALKRILQDGRASMDGETYIPDPCIEDYDREYGTNYGDGKDERAWVLDGARLSLEALIGAKGTKLPSAEEVQALIGQLRKYSADEFDQHNNYIAEDLADAADVLSMLVAADFFVSMDAKNAEKVDPVAHDPLQVAPCSVGDPAFLFFHDEKTGLTHIDAFKVNEVSNRRIWLGDDMDYSHDEIGKEVFLSRENAVAYAKEHGMRLAQPDLDLAIQDAEGLKKIPDSLKNNYYANKDVDRY